MQAQISDGPAFGYAEITLPPGGVVRVEAGAMAMTRGDVETSTSTRGGFLKGLQPLARRRELLRQRLQLSQGGIVGVAPALPGDMAMARSDGPGVLVQSGSWIASDPTIDVDS